MYVSGTEDNAGISTAKYWKNGVAVNLSDGSNSGYCNAIFSFGNDTYMAGSVYETGTRAAYWKNNKKVIVDTTAYTSEANGIFIK